MRNIGGFDAVGEKATSITTHRFWVNKNLECVTGDSSDKTFLKMLTTLGYAETSSGSGVYQIPGNSNAVTSDLTALKATIDTHTHVASGDNAGDVQYAEA